MPSFTPNLNLYLPGGGSSSIGGADEVVDVDKLNENFQKVDEFAGEMGRNAYRVGTNTERLNLTGSALFEGLLFRTTDTDMLWIYDSAAWYPFFMRGVLNGPTATNVPNNVPTVIDLDDPGNLPNGITWDETAKTVKIQRAGRYRLMGAGRWQTNGTGYRVLQLQQNGNPLTGRSSIPAISGIEMMQTAWAIIDAAVNDVVNLVGYHTVGSTIEFRGAQLTIEAF